MKMLEILKEMVVKIALIALLTTDIIIIIETFGLKVMAVIFVVVVVVIVFSFLIIFIGRHWEEDDHPPSYE